MQTKSSVIPRKDYLFFDLACCIDELYNIRNDLCRHDMDEIEQACKKLRQFIEERQLSSQVYLGNYEMFQSSSEGMSA